MTWFLQWCKWHFMFFCVIKKEIWLALIVEARPDVNLCSIRRWQKRSTWSRSSVRSRHGRRRGRRKPRTCRSSSRPQTPPRRCGGQTGRPRRRSFPRRGRLRNRWAAVSFPSAAHVGDATCSSPGETTRATPVILGYCSPHRHHYCDTHSVHRRWLLTPRFVLTFLRENGFKYIFVLRTLA